MVAAFLLWLPLHKLWYFSSQVGKLKIIPYLYFTFQFSYWDLLFTGPGEPSNNNKLIKMWKLLKPQANWKVKMKSLGMEHSFLSPNGSLSICCWKLIWLWKLNTCWTTTELVFKTTNKLCCELKISYECSG